MSNNITDEFLASYDILMEKALEKIRFDKTIVCTISKVYENEIGKYRVTNGTISFDAQASTDTQYKLDESVYVLIPQNDYSQEKIITGKYNSQDSELLTKEFKRLSDHFISCYDFCTFDANQQFKIDQRQFNNSSFGELNKILISCNISTQSQDDLPFAYNIIFAFRDFSNKIVHSIVISQDDVTGNPFSFFGADFTQEFLYPLPENFDINTISLIEYWVKNEDGLLGSSIEVTDIHIKFGFDKNLITAEKAVINAPGYITNGKYIDILENLSYNQNKDINTKVLQAELALYDIDLKDYVIYNSLNQLPTAQVFWLTYTPNVDNEYKELAEIKGKDWKVQSAGVWEYEYSPDFTKATDQVMCIIKLDNMHYWKSEPLIFQNEIKGVTQVISGSLSFAFQNSRGDSEEPIFNIYGPNNSALSNSNLKKHRVFVNFNNYTDSPEDLKTVIWKIPAYGSMIEPDEDWGEPKDGYYTIIQTDLETLSGFAYFDYNIKTGFSTTLTNNSVYCEVTHLDGKEKMSGEFSLQFGYAQSNGMNYSFNIVADKTDLIWDADKEDTVTLKAVLEDGDGNEIPLNVNNNSLSWSWYYDNAAIESFSNNSEDIVWKSRNNNQIVLKLNSHSGSVKRFLHGGVVQAKAILNIGGNNLSFEAQVPLALHDENYVGFEGSHTFIYNSLRTIATYQRTPYKLYNKSGNSINITTIDLKYSGSTSASITQAPIYISDDKKQVIPVSILPSIVAPYALMIDNIWLQAILAKTEIYGVAELNLYNSTGKIEQISDRMFGYIQKDTENKATGVLMGELTDINGSNTTRTRGFFGFKDGERTIAITDDGNAYFKGEVRAGSGNIGGWDLNEKFLYNVAYSDSNKTKGYLTAILPKNFDEDIRSNGDIRYWSIIVNSQVSRSSQTQSWDDALTGGYTQNFVQNSCFCVDQQGNAYINNQTDEGINIRFGKSDFFYRLVENTSLETLNNAPGLSYSYDSNHGSVPVNTNFFLGVANIVNKEEYHPYMSVFTKFKTEKEDLTSSLAPKFTICYNYNKEIVAQDKGEWGNYQNFSPQLNLLLGASDPLAIQNGDCGLNMQTSYWNIPTEIEHSVAANNSDQQRKSHISLFANAYNKTAYLTFDVPAYGSSLATISADKGRLAGTWEADTWQGSDQNIKNTILDIDQPYDNLFDLLKPVSYKLNKGTSNRIHTGFIAQDVKDAIESAGLTTQDFAGLIITDKDEWGLRYDEFIALNTHEIQKLKQRVSELEALLEKKEILL